MTYPHLSPVDIFNYSFHSILTYPHVNNKWSASKIECQA
ncbi:hypothetical protein FM106_06865 [Brachybacterium faecium]|nr:hypothetical protein FM106_06865 [Brachybacterium faecium]